jgi:energy-coupling factor transporter transmembrane protein EcfT
VLAFLTSAIVQVIKELPWFCKFPTSAVALAVSMILCPMAVVILCAYAKLPITWYYVFASFIAAFIVYIISTGGWDKLNEIWNRTKYKGGNQ